MTDATTHAERGVAGFMHVAEAARQALGIAPDALPLARQPRHSFPGDVELLFRIGPRDRRSDCTNRIKAAEDLLVHHGIIADDRLVVRATIEWADDVKGCEVTVTDRRQEVAA